MSTSLARIEAALAKIDSHLDNKGGMAAFSDSQLIETILANTDEKMDALYELQCRAKDESTNVVTKCTVLFPFLKDCLSGAEGKDGRVSAATLCWYLCRCPEFRTAALKSDEFMKSLIELARDGAAQEDSGREQAVRALTNVAAADESEKPLIEVYDVASVLINILTGASIKCKGAACSLIRNLAASAVCNGRTKFLTALIEAGSIGRIAVVFDSSDEMDIYRAAGAIGSVCYHSKESGISGQLCKSLAEPLSAECGGDGSTSMLVLVDKTIKGRRIKMEKTLAALREAHAHMQALMREH